jgi:hypothetical protein
LHAARVAGPVSDFIGLGIAVVTVSGIAVVTVSIIVKHHQVDVTRTRRYRMKRPVWPVKLLFPVVVIAAQQK